MPEGGWKTLPEAAGEAQARIGGHWGVLTAVGDVVSGWRFRYGIVAHGCALGRRGKAGGVGAEGK